MIILSLTLLSMLCFISSLCSINDLSEIKVDIEDFGAKSSLI
jgi:hypothetical protein